MNPLDAAETRPLEGGISYPFSHRLFRLVWAWTWLLLASWTPAPLHRWRVFLLRMAGAEIHPSAHVYGSARIWYPPNLQMRKHACLGPKVNCYNMATISLGDGAIVSQGAHLCAGSHNIDGPHFQLVVRAIDIGSQAWIAAESFVGPGVVVGEGAVIGARSVIFKDAAPWGVYAGNPARFIRMRVAHTSENCS